MSFTTMFETLLDAGGQPLAETVVIIELVADLDGPAAAYTDEGTIARSYEVRTDSAGTWTLALEPTALITQPAGTFYRIHVAGDEDEIVRAFAVPESATPVELTAALLIDPPDALPTPALTVERDARIAADADLQDQIDAIQIAASGAYRHVQSVPASTWTIAHNLGFHPNVTAFDSAGTEVGGRVAHLNSNSLTISFFVGGAPASFSGEAYAS